MGSLKRTSLLITAGALLAMVLYVLCRCIVSWKQGYRWDEMDWNQDGTTTLSEFFEASDIGRRDVSRDGKTCREYYEFKDASTIRTDCGK